MILTLIDGRETVFLAIGLRAIEEEKRHSEILELFADRERVAVLAEEIRRFAKAKLAHPVLKHAREEMVELSATYQEMKTKYKPK